jgi:hypothetical protein
LKVSLDAYQQPIQNPSWNAFKNPLKKSSFSSYFHIFKSGAKYKKKLLVKLLCLAAKINYHPLFKISLLSRQLWNN